MPDPQVSPAPSKTKSRLAVVLALVLGAGGIFVWMGPARPASAPESNAGVGSTFALETFVVNLSGSGERAYLRVGITLGLSRPPSSRNKEEGIPVALVRDTILSVLSTARPEQLLQPEGKRQLKAEILQALKDRAPQLGVEDVYFTEFLVQM
jgi:flagellar basal body-associated protein FliL